MVYDMNAISMKMTGKIHAIAALSPWKEEYFHPHEADMAPKPAVFVLAYRVINTVLSFLKRIELSAGLKNINGRRLGLVLFILLF
jgi:hypothetical protein